MGNRRGVSPQPAIPIFLDRDGVLIRTFIRAGVPHPPRRLDEVEILPGVPESLQRLRSRGCLLLVVTNQPDVARGAQTRQTVEQINQLLLDRLPLDGIYTCYHDTRDGCACRKPAPGLFLTASSEHSVDPSAGFMVGDRWSDIAAGRAAGCRTILIGRPYSAAERCSPDRLVADLTEAADWILQFRSDVRTQR